MHECWWAREDLCRLQAIVTQTMTPARGVRVDLSHCTPDLAYCGMLHLDGEDASSTSFHATYERGCSEINTGVLHQNMFGADVGGRQ